MADTLIKMTVESGDKTYVVVFLGSAPRTKVNLDGMEVLIDTTATLEPGTVIEGEYTMSANTTLVLDANPTAEGVAYQPEQLSASASVRRLVSEQSQYCYSSCLKERKLSRALTRIRNINISRR
jgi:hypothetical protein